MNIEQEIYDLKARNLRVEADKAWEVSTSRKASIAVLTYGVAVALLYAVGNAEIFRNALVPVAGYLLSTQSLPFLKKWWVAKYRGVRN